MGKTGRRIWYGIAIFLSTLMLLLSAAGIVGLWIAEGIVATSVVELIAAAERITGTLQQTTGTIDQKLASVQEVTTSISDGAAKISQNVTDQGLIGTLLPEEKSQSLSELASSVKERVTSLREMIAAGVALYRTIDRLPLIDLPSIDQEKVDKIAALAGEIETTVDNLRADIAAFRSGASDKIGKVQSGAEAVSSLVDQSRDQLEGLDSRLILIHKALSRIQQVVLTALIAVAVLGTLFLAWVVYSQVELLRLYIQRWKTAGAADDQGVTGSLAPQS